jgi:uncharacterized metal-binding protein YceD (DUF177 family)
MSEPTIPPPEFSRVVDRRSITGEPMGLEATEAERAALAERFALVRIDSLSARLTLEADGEEVKAHGRLQAAIVQSCAVSGEDLPVEIDEELALVFVPERGEEPEEEEIELEEEELDEIPYSGTAFDLGEAVAQSLALSIDPYATGPEADRAREEHDLAEKGPQGPLQNALAAALKKD